MEFIKFVEQIPNITIAKRIGLFQTERKIRYETVKFIIFDKNKL